MAADNRTRVPSFLIRIGTIETLFTLTVMIALEALSAGVGKKAECSKAKVDIYHERSSLAPNVNGLSTLIKPDITPIYFVFLRQDLFQSVAL